MGDKQKRILTSLSYEVEKAQSHMIKGWTTEISATITDHKGVGNGRKTVIETGWVSKIQ